MDVGVLCGVWIRFGGSSDANFLEKEGGNMLLAGGWVLLNGPTVMSLWACVGRRLPEERLHRWYEKGEGEDIVCRFDGGRCR